MIRHARILLVGAAAFSSACVRDVTVEGIILAYRNAPVAASGVDLELRDADFQVYATGTTGLDGAFALKAPVGSDIHLVVSGPGLVPIAFAGASGVSSSFVVPAGQLWAFRDIDAQAWRDDFAGCPDAADGAGMILGTTYLAVDVGDGSAAGQLWPDAFAYVEPRATPGQDRKDACYLTDEATGAVYDPSATLVGATGRFAIFGVEGGPWTLTVARCAYKDATGCTSSVLGRSTVYVPEGGAVERNPALVPL